MKQGGTGELVVVTVGLAGVGWYVDHVWSGGDLESPLGWLCACLLVALCLLLTIRALTGRSAYELPIGARIVAHLVLFVLVGLGTTAGYDAEAFAEDPVSALEEFGILCLDAIPFLLVLGAVLFLPRRWPDAGEASVQEPRAVGVEPRRSVASARATVSHADADAAPQAEANALRGRVASAFATNAPLQLFAAAALLALLTEFLDDYAYTGGFDYGLRWITGASTAALALLAVVCTLTARRPATLSVRTAVGSLITLGFLLIIGHTFSDAAENWIEEPAQELARLPQHALGWGAFLALLSVVFLLPRTLAGTLEAAERHGGEGKHTNTTTTTTTNNNNNTDTNNTDTQPDGPATR